MIIYGINPVLEALRAGRVKEVRVGDRSGDRMRQVLALASERGVKVRRVPADVLDRDAKRGVHQGIVADVESVSTYSLGELVRGADGPALIVVLDGIEDPHNLARSCGPRMPPAHTAWCCRIAARPPSRAQQPRHRQAPSP